MLIVTIAALVMAASLGWFAYRLMQEDQRRSEARVALLTAALQDERPASIESAMRSDAVGFAPMPSALAGPTSRGQAARLPELVFLDDDARAGGWFRSEEPHQTEPAPIAAVDAALADAPVMTPRHTASAMSTDVDVQTRGAGLFADVPESRPADARGAIALGGVVLVGILALGYVWFGRPAVNAPVAPAASSSSAPAVTATPVQGGIPLELLSLAHERRGSTLVVRGTVRNPVSGSDRAGVVASVMLLDQAGGVLGSGRAPVRTTRLSPGDATDFAVEVPSHKDVRRYRVTFRGVDGGVVPHADRRAARP
jgi:hypothetical protein